MAKKTKQIVLARNEKTGSEGIELDGQKMDFVHGSALWVDDPGKAEAIQQKYGNNVAVTKDQQLEWSVNNENGNGTRMDNIHKYTFQGVDMSGIRTTKDNGYVWAYVGGGRQKRMKREEALREGYEIVPQNRERRRRYAEEVA